MTIKKIKYILSINDYELVKFYDGKYQILKKNNDNTYYVYSHIFSNKKELKKFIKKHFIKV